MPAIIQTEYIVEFLGADTSVPRVRHAVCWLFSLFGPVAAGAVLVFLPERNFISYCMVASPLTGLSASLLWLAWPWIRTDIQRGLFHVLAEDRGAGDDETQSREAPERRTRVVEAISSSLDRAEKASYVYVGATLALSWVLSMPPVLHSLFS
jgi:hypothetical protein